MKEKLKYLFILSFSIFYSVVFAQKSLSFNECLEIAFKNNLQIQNAFIDEDIAAYQLKNSKTKLLPTIDASLGNKYSWGRGIDPNTNSYINQQFKSYNGEVGSNLLLFNGFTNLTAIKQAKQELELSNNAIQKIKNEITIEIASKFTNILYLQEIVKSNQEQLKSTLQQLENVQLKFDEGYIAKSEVFKIKSQLATEEHALLNNKNLLEINLLDLKQLMNISLDEEITLIEPKEKLFTRIEIDANDKKTIENAVRKNPEFLIFNINEEKAKLDIASAKAPLYPKLSAGFKIDTRYSDNNKELSFNEQINSNLSYGLNLTLSIPIFSQLDNHFKIKENKLLYEKAKNQTLLEKNRLSKVIVQAIYDANASYSKYQSSLSSFEYSQKSYEADSLKFEYGRISVNELLVTKNNYIKAEAEVIQAKYELIFNQSIVNYYLTQRFEIE